MASNPLAGSNEIVMVVSDHNNIDRALVWNGTTWGNLQQLDASGGQNMSDLGVAYEQLDGRALVTYAADNNNGLVGYRIWNGSTWSAAATIAAPAGAAGYAQWTTLAADPNSNHIVLGVQTMHPSAWVDFWNGSAWGTATLGTATMAMAQSPNNNLAVSVAFDDKSGNALFVYQNAVGAGATQTQLQYQTFNGTAWSAPVSFDTSSQPVITTTLNSNPYSDQIMLMVNDHNKVLTADLWTGTSFNSPIQLEANTNFNQGQPFTFSWDSYLPHTTSTSVTFTQTAAMTSPFVLPASSAVMVTTYISIASGAFPPPYAARAEYHCDASVQRDHDHDDSRAADSDPAGRNELQARVDRHGPEQRDGPDGRADRPDVYRLRYDLLVQPSVRQHCRPVAGAGAHRHGYHGQFRCSLQRALPRRLADHHHHGGTAHERPFHDQRPLRRVGHHQR
jgi:hypothetical protein